jgi:peptidyl-prolyl cis-trans isomerase B (cyclophilin B)
LARLLACFLALALALAACGDDDSGGGDAAESSEPPPSEPAEAGGCKDVPQPEPRPEGGAAKPSERLDPDKTYLVVMTTSCGEIQIRLDQEVAPKTTASFASLTRAGFFDETVFHRIVPGFVIQGGDPTASGIGGPGYSTREAPPPDTRYVNGTVAMAKRGTEPPGTARSQFFVVAGPEADLLPEYALLGKVVKGLDVVEAIAQLGDGSGVPRQPVVIDSAELVER